MGTIRTGLGMAATLLLAGCVGYGFPADASHGGYYGGDGYYGGGYHGGGYGAAPGAGTVRCESEKNRTRHCAFDTRGGVTLARQLSRTRCQQGRNWGWDGRGVWVSQGCRAEFVAGRGGQYRGDRPGRGNQGYGQTVRCESDRRRQRRCNVAVPRGVELVRQLSDAPCVRGRTWGSDRSGIWVDGGCRAEFRVY